MNMTGLDAIKFMEAYQLPEDQIRNIVYEHFPTQSDGACLSAKELSAEAVATVLTAVRVHQESQQAHNANITQDGISEMLLYLEHTPTFKVSFDMTDILKICGWLEELKSYRNA